MLEYSAYSGINRESNEIGCEDKKRCEALQVYSLDIKTMGTSKRCKRLQVIGSRKERFLLATMACSTKE